MVVPIQVVTRAQEKENPKLQPKEPEQVPIKKKKNKSWREQKARLVAKKPKGGEEKQQKKDDKTNATSSSNNLKHKGELILLDKIFEPLDTFLMA